ncbi:hypothetical protein [Roseivivax sediminis]|uniref:AAA+ family ATPase n=1 Tax=Roseivivax sediminis TaxID=936889 RepID=A0A1I1XKM5_9RHOB|nr:hypothetical protein [Roseivivax sediminis]SFE07751.1 hypothetical protein SAMN04515678_10631 [Roseivivax sediminis]
MRHLIAIPLALSLLAAPAMSQDAVEDDEGRGFSLMERGAQLFFRGMMDEMEPALRDLRALAEDLGPELQDFVSEMGPALRGVLERVEDWSAYHPPEILDNGDIIMRRKADRPPLADPSDDVDI